MMASTNAVRVSVLRCSADQITGSSVFFVTRSRTKFKTKRLLFIRQRRCLATLKTGVNPTPAGPSHHHQHYHFRRLQKTKRRHSKTPSQKNVADSKTSTRHRSSMERFWNPWYDLANVTTDNTLLSFKIESVTRTFGVVAALMCSLSAAALYVTPEAPEEENKGDTITTSSKHEKGVWGHVSDTSLLLRWGLSARKTHDLYTCSCAGAFYSSVCAMGLSTVISAWLAATPLSGTRYFVKYHSLVICSIPGLLAISTGLAGVSLFIGLDRSKGTPISYIGLGGTLIGGILITTATVRGMVCTYRLLTPLVKKL